MFQGVVGFRWELKFSASSDFYTVSYHDEDLLRAIKHTGPLTRTGPEDCVEFILFRLGVNYILDVYNLVHAILRAGLGL